MLPDVIDICAHTPGLCIVLNIIINVILHLYILKTQLKETEVLHHKSGYNTLFLWTTTQQIQYIQLYVTNRGAIY